MRETTDINEIQAAVLKIALEFKRIMDKHHIPYFMIGGTMLGAIRHGGFISWDDDMDFGVLRSDYERTKEVLKKELSFPYKFLYGEEGQVNYDSSKIEDSSTIIIEKDRNSEVEQTGLFIDIFPIDVCDNKFGSFSRNRWIKHFMGINELQYQWPNDFFLKIAALVAHIMPKNFFLKLAHKMITSEGDYYINYGGMYGAREIVPISFFGRPVEYKFESVSFTGVEKSDRYLTNVYGDYMKLPPESKRHTHILACYMK